MNDDKPMEQSPLKEDRRKIRTRRMLKEALVALIQEAGYDALTIQQITDRADLRRATFYLHFATKDELLAYVLREMFDALVAEIGPTVTQGDVLAGKTRLEPFQAMFEHVAAHRALYRALLLGAAGVGISRMIHTYLAGLLIGSLGLAGPGQVAAPPEALAHYLAGAELGLMTWWLESESALTPAAMAALAQRLVLEGARGVIAGI
jgi:AcrR family transcriptional regulator